MNNVGKHDVHATTSADGRAAAQRIADDASTAGGGLRADAGDVLRAAIAVRVRNAVPLVAERRQRARELARRNAVARRKHRVDTAANVPIVVAKSMLDMLGVKHADVRSRAFAARIVVFAGDASFASAGWARGQRPAAVKELLKALQRRYVTIVMDEYLVRRTHRATNE